MGTTGLETAFAALYTELVRARRARRSALVVERMTAGGALFDLPAPRIAVGEPANLVLVDLDAEWEVGEDGYESRSENCCFAGPRAARARAAHASPPARVAYRERALRGDGASVTGAYVLLEDGTRFDGDAVRRRRRTPTGEVVFTTGMSGYQESMTDPSLRRPAHHLHLPAHRQLRRQRGGDGVRPRPWARAAIMRAAVNREDAPGRRARLAGLAAPTAASRRSPASTRARSCATSATRARCAAASSRRAMSRGRGARA